MFVLPQPCEDGVIISSSVATSVRRRVWLSGGNDCFRRSSHVSAMCYFAVYSHAPLLQYPLSHELGSKHRGADFKGVHVATRVWQKWWNGWNFAMNDSPGSWMSALSESRRSSSCIICAMYGNMWPREWAGPPFKGANRKSRSVGFVCDRRAEAVGDGKLDYRITANIASFMRLAQLFL